MKKNYISHAELLISDVIELQRLVLVKHTASILEEIHDQLKARDAEIARLKQQIKNLKNKHEKQSTD